MKQYITPDDLDVINFYLDCGQDVSIQVKGENKVRIIAQTVKVLKKKELTDEEE